MPADRYIITDRQWAKIEAHCLGKKSDPADGWGRPSVSGGAGLRDRGRMGRPSG